MNFGICDNEPAALFLMEQLAVKALNELNVTDVTFRSYTSGQALLDNISDIDLVFLDIDMPGLNGIETGKQLRTIKPDCCIVMATGREDCFKDAFKINAFRYITKPFEYSEIFEAIKSYLDAQIGMNIIEVYKDRIAYSICEKDIFYTKAYNSYVEIVTKTECFRSDKSLSHIATLLDTRLFFQIDRTHIINLLHIKQYTNESAIVGSETFSISRRRRKEFEQKYIEFDIHYKNTI